MKTNLTAKELKTLIEEKGSNLIQKTIKLPMKVFLLPIEQQKAIASKEVLHSEKHTDVELTFKSPNPEDFNFAIVDVTIRVEESVLEELIAEEDNFELTHKEYELVSKGQPLSVLKEWANNGLKKLIVSVPKKLLMLPVSSLKKELSSFISKDLPLTDFNYVAYQADPLNDNNYLIKVYLTLNPQVIVDRENELVAINKVYEQFSESEYKPLFTPYDLEELKALVADQEPVNEQNRVFKYLLEFKFSDLRNEIVLENEEMFFSENIVKGIYIEDLKYKAVGFNPVTNKVIFAVVATYWF